MECSIKLLRKGDGFDRSIFVLGGELLMRYKIVLRKPRRGGEERRG